MDFEILLWIRDHLHNPVTEAVFPVISFLGNAGLIWLLTAAVLLCFRRSRRAGVLVIAVGLNGAALILFTLAPPELPVFVG